MRSPTLLLLFALCAHLLPGCGSDDEPEPEPKPDAGDGKVRPPASGVHTTEAGACQALLDGYGGRRDALQCQVTTMRTCPSLIRAQVGGTQCLEYDQGSVDGCVAYYNAQDTCEALGDAVDACVVTAYPGTEPNGCP